MTAARTGPTPATDHAQPAGGRSFGYHPALDGIRAIAVVMVVVHHAHLQSAWSWVTRPASWLGVDVFFVLSGFLITLLLLQEVDRRGTVRLGAFYVRRFLRLYPMILVVLVIAGASLVLLPPGHASRTTPVGIASIAFYFTNWLGISADSNASLGMFGHLWSLAIEEQFYLVWPLVILASVRLGSRRIGPFLVAAAGAGASALYRAWTWHEAKAWGGGASLAERRAHVQHAEVFWYQSSLTRVDGLLIGCAFAVLVVSLRGPTVARLAAAAGRVTGWNARQTARGATRMIGLLGLAGAVVAEGIVWTQHGFVHPEFLIGPGLPLFELAVALVIVHVVVNATGLMARGLSLRPLVWTGRRSYAIYLLHPMFLSLAVTYVADTQPVRVGALAFTFVVAGLSYRYYEAPILRLKGRYGAGREEPATRILEPTSA